MRIQLLRYAQKHIIMISISKKSLSFRTKEAKIKKEIQIIYEAAERLGRMINPDLPMIGKELNISTGLSRATVEYIEYDASKLFEFIGYTLVDCDVQAKELEDGVKNLIKGHFAQIQLVSKITDQVEGCLNEGNQEKQKGKN